MKKFKIGEDFKSSLPNFLETEESLLNEKEEDWVKHIRALGNIGAEREFWKEEKEVESTLWEKTASEEAVLDPEEYNVFQANTRSETLPSYLKRCTAKYETYSPQERAFLSEALLSWFLIEGKLGNPLPENKGIAWNYRINAMRATFQDTNKYLSRLVQCVDIPEVFPVIFRVLEEGKEEKFSLVEDFLRREASYYESVSIKEAILTFPAEKAKRLIKGRKIVEMLNVSSGKETGDRVREKCGIFAKQWKPERIVSFLNAYLIGQKDAKKAAAMLLYTHVLRVAHPDTDAKKSNFLFLGPTGCGKTELFRLLKKISPVSIHIVDSTSLTSEGFVGLNKGDLLRHLKEESDDNLETSIIVLDECDKMIRPEFSSSGENVNVSIQGDILKMVEGSKILAGMSTIDTTRITFVFTGAFAGLLDREKAPPVCGFMKESEAKQTINLEEKLCEYGMIPELAGRIGEFVVLEPLKKGDYLRILELVIKPENNIAELYRREDGIQISFETEALEEIAEQAAKSNLGARQLTNFVGQAVRQEVYDAMKDGRGEAVITKERICDLKRNKVERR